MYTDEQNELLEKVEVLKKEKSLSQNAVCRLIGVSETADIMQIHRISLILWKDISE